MTDRTHLRHGLALGLLLAAVVLPGSLSAQQRHGDVNGDGVVSALDAQAILTGVVALPLPSGYVLANGDSNCDGATGAIDAQIVLQFVIGLGISQFCVNQPFGPDDVTVRITPTDTSVLINRGLRLRAILTDGGGFNIERPIVWSSTNTDLIAIDSARGDTAWVSNHGQAFDATATISAFADGATSSTTIRVFRSYAGVAIRQQRGDTLRQLNGTRTFTAGNRDSLGTITPISSATVNWSVLNPTIATVNTDGVATALTSGSTWLRIVSQTNPADQDSVPLVVMLPPLNTCTGEGGTLYPAQTFTTPQTWSPTTNPHYVAGSLTFNATSGLTIEKGALICLSSGASMTFQAGSQMIARGTPDSTIRFLPTIADQPWGGITFGSVSGYSGVSTDTSIITNAVFERAGQAVWGREQHALVLDSVVARQFQTIGVRVLGPGSRLSRSVIDTVGVGGGSFAVTVGRGTVEATTIRPGATGSGITPSEAGVIRDVMIVGGTTGIGQGSGAGLRMTNVTITGSSATGLDLTNHQLDPASANVQVTGALYAYRGGIGNLAILWPDSVAQAGLLGNLRDTVFFTTGSGVRNRTVTLRPDIRWVATSEILVDTQAVLNLRPGTRIAFQNAGIRVRNSGRVLARGTAALPVMLVAQPGQTFYGLTFENPQIPAGGFTPEPRDTSYLVNVRVDSASTVYCGTGSCGAISAHDRHTLMIDSAWIRYSLNGGVVLSARGSRISRSLIDTTGNPTSNYPALFLGGGTLAESLTVRRSGLGGVTIGGAATDSVRLRALRIEDSEGVGLHAEGARIVGDSGSVITVANAYAYRGYIDSFGAIARDSLAQLNLLGNTSDRVEIVGRSDRRLRGRPGRIDSLRMIPQVSWLLANDVYVDTLARLVPSPGARVGFAGGYIHFTRGGQLHSRGTQAAPIVLEKYSPTSGIFNGIQFANKGGTGLDTSYVTNTQIRTVESCLGGSLGCAAFATQDRHVLIVDSVAVDSTTYTAISLAAPGSRISRSLIDKAGQPTSYAGLELGRGTLAESTTVRNSLGTGVLVSGSVTSLADTIRLRGLRVLNNGGVGLHAEGGRIVGDSGSVTATGNAYPFRGYIDNFGVLAMDSISQLNLLGNTADRVEIVGRSDRRFSGRAGRIDSLRVIPQLPWMVINDAYVDTLARLVPSPGSRVGFWGGYFHFTRGGQLHARGTATAPIVLEKWSATSGIFTGLQFANKGGAGLDTSYVTNTQIRTVESCLGGSLGCASLATQDRHVLIVDSARVDSTTYTAISLAAPGSRISRSVIDLAGQPTSYAGLELGRATLAETTTVRRSRGTGVQVSGSVTAPGDTIRLRALTIQNSGAVGLRAEGGRIVGDSGSVTATGNAYPFRGYIDNFGVLAMDSISQLNLLGNTADRVEIVGRSDRRFSGRPDRIDSLRVIPQLPWMVVNDAYVDTLARLVPSPGARVGFASGYMHFTRGGQLHARGTATAPIVLEKWSATSGIFTGLQFANKGGTGLDTSYVTNTQIRTIESCLGGSLGCASLATQDRHVLIVDSAEVRQTTYTAVSLAAPGSRISRSLIDVAGQPTTYAGLNLGRATLAESTTVQNARGTGVLISGSTTAPADTIRLRRLNILNSGGVGLHAEGGRIVGDSGSVTATGNAYPFRGYIDNFAAIAPDSLAQDNLLGNSDNVAIIIGRGDRRLMGSEPAHSIETPLVLTSIPQLRWQVQGLTYVDTLARFAPRPGANLTFTSGGGLSFESGGTLRANGTATDSIWFRPVGTGNFVGLAFHSPDDDQDPFTTAPVAFSEMSFVKLDSASGQSLGFGCCAAINTENRHYLSVTDAKLRRNQLGAIWLQAPNSRIERVVVDTTGAPTTTHVAIALNDTTSATDLLVRRSGGPGIHVDGNAITLTNVRVVQSVGVGVGIVNNNTAANGGSQGLQLSGFTVDSAGGTGVTIAASSVQMSGCNVLRGAGNGLATTGGFPNVVISGCNIEENLGLGVSNADVTNIVNEITATNNFWGFDSQGLFITPVVGGLNGVSLQVLFLPVAEVRFP